LKQPIFKIGLLVAAAALAAGILLLPKAPKEATEKITGVNAKIARASALVQNGTNPMEGIRLLREVLEEDPENTEVHYRLGMFSMQSGQFDKAIARFEKVVSKNDPKYNDAIFFLAQAYAATNRKDEAIILFNRYRKTSTDTAVTNGVDRLINELSNQ
jgi:Tfp pilus assembly protein PilF